MTERYVYTIDSPPVDNLPKVGDDSNLRIFVLQNKTGMRASVAGDSGRLLSLLVPDANRKLIEVIEDAYVVTGYKGNIGNVFLDAVKADEKTIELTYADAEINRNFGGNVGVKVQYTLTDDNRLKITCEATNSEATAMLFTDNIYFNLNGTGNNGFFDHLLQINADNYLPLNNEVIWTGEIENVSATPFDFRKATAIGARINDNNEQLRNGCGFHHFFVLNKHSRRTPVARVKGGKSGLVMELCTDEGGLQFCCSNLVACRDGRDKSKKDARRIGFCLNPGNLPYQAFGEPTLAEDFVTKQRFKSVIVYRFKSQ